MSIFGKLTGALIGTLFGPFGILIGILLGHFADIAMESAPGRGSFGTETAELVAKIMSLWGKIVSHGGGPNQVQVLFLQGVLTNQLHLRGAEVRVALQDFELALVNTRGQSWTSVLEDTLQTAREIYQGYFLDRQTLVWIYATGRRLASLGTVRTGLAEMLDLVAKAFMVFEEVGSAGTQDYTNGDENQYQKTWQNFRPASAVGPKPMPPLGLAPEASVDQIKKTYRTLVLQYHPDAHNHLPDGDPLKKKAAERFLQIQQAYERIRKARKF